MIIPFTALATYAALRLSGAGAGTATLYAAQAFAAALVISF